MRVVFPGGCGIALLASGLNLRRENRTDRMLGMLTAFVTVLGLALIIRAVGLALPEGCGAWRGGVLHRASGRLLAVL